MEGQARRQPLKAGVGSVAWLKAVLATRAFPGAGVGQRMAGKNKRVTRNSSSPQNSRRKDSKVDHGSG